MMTQTDDPGGTEDETQNNHTLNNKIITSRTNGINVNYIKATKDQLTSSSSNQSPIVTGTTALINNNNTTNDSKYLHKKFKKFCATVDSNQTNHNFNCSNNNISHNSTVINNTIATTASLSTSSSSSITVVAGLLNNNNNSEIVENKNSWISTEEVATEQHPQDTSLRSYHQHNHHHHHQHNNTNSNQFQSVPLSPTPKHLQTTEEEKQLVKDIIDINNENFIHQSANRSLSLQNPSSFLITNSASGGSLVTVTTLGNHNSNFQTGDLRHKSNTTSQQQEPATISYANNHQTHNGNFVIINNQLSVDYSHQQQPPSTASNTTTTSVPTTTNQGPGRYICPYCQLNCAKPSVLQKHIRAHTNERPSPCNSCGFAFKTKSNLYKHCR